MSKGGKGGSGSGSGGSTTTTSKTELPDWVTSAAQRNLNASYDVAQKMLGPYQGPTYAQLTPGAQANIAGLQSLVGSTQPAYNLAQGTLGGLTGFSADQVNAPTLANTNLSPYMNPYTDAVTRSGLNAINVQRQQALNQNADQAIAQRAFGGSRQGVQEGITNAAAGMQAGQLAAQLGQQNYTQAQQAASQDIANNLNAQQVNAANRLSAAGLNQNAATSLAGVASQGQQTNLQGLMGALQGQTLAQQDQQGRLSADQAAYQAAQQFPLQQLQIPSSILSATPYGSTTTGTSAVTPPAGNGLMQGLGAASAGIGILGNLFGSGGLMGGAGGIGSLFALSDRDSKTDIEKLGRDPETGVDLYAYRYRDDPKSYPKVVGPMAQDVEKAIPGSTKRVGGKLVIKRSML
jgi:hypothetical protein